MEAKKPVLLAVLVLALLAVALIVPAAAMGKSDKQPVSWASLRTNTNNDLLDQGKHQGTSGKVQLLADGALKGQVLLKELLGFYDGVRIHSFIRVDTFTFTFDGMNFDQADFYHGEGDYEGADIAEFVGYAPNPDYPTMGPPMFALKFLWIDYGEPGKDDLMQWYVLNPPNEEIPFFHWVPQLVFPGNEEGNPIPIPNGNIQVYVGADGE